MMSVSLLTQTNDMFCVKNVRRWPKHDYSVLFLLRRTVDKCIKKFMEKKNIMITYNKYYYPRRTVMKCYYLKKTINTFTYFSIYKYR